MVTQETGEHLDRIARDNQVSMSEVARTYIDAGIELGKAALDGDITLDAALELVAYASAKATGDSSTLVMDEDEYRGVAPYEQAPR